MKDQVSACEAIDESVADDTIKLPISALKPGPHVIQMSTQSGSAMHEV